MPTAVDAEKQQKLGAIGEAKARKDIATLEKFLYENLVDVRSEATKALVPLGAFEVFVRHAGDKKWMAANESIRVLGETGDPQYFPLLLKACRHKDSNVKSAAMHYLAKHKVPGALKEIARNLGDRSWPVRQSAVQALGRLKDRDAIPLLQRSLKDKEDTVRSTAVVELAKLGEPLEELVALVLPTFTADYQRVGLYQLLRQGGFKVTTAQLTPGVQAKPVVPAAPAAPERQFFVFSVANGALAMILQTGLRDVGKVKGFPLGERTLFLKYTNQPIEDAHEKSKVPTMTALNSLAGPWILVVDIATLEDFQSTSVWKNCQMVGQVAASPQPIIDFVQKAMG